MQLPDGSMIEVTVSAHGEGLRTTVDRAEWRTFLEIVLALDYPKAAVNVIVGDATEMQVRAWHASDDEHGQGPASTRMSADVRLICERAWANWRAQHEPEGR